MNCFCRKDAFAVVLGGALTVAGVWTSEAQVSEVSYEGSADHSYFILISGGCDAVRNGIRHWADTAMNYSTLTRKYGVPKDHIWVYMSDGGKSGADANIGSMEHPILVSSPTDLDGDGLSDITGPATRAAVSTAFTSTLRNRLGPNDRLFVFFTSHGNTEHGTDSIGWLWSTDCTEYFRDDELHAWTKDIRCPVAFAMSACYAGGFVDDIIKTPNRVIATSCREDELTWGWDGTGKWEDGTVGKTMAYSEWMLVFATGLRGFEPRSAHYYSYPWEDADKVAKVVDANKDGMISFYEAQAYAMANDLARCQKTSHGTCRPTDYVEHAQYAESTPGLGARMFILDQDVHPDDWVGVSINGVDLSTCAGTGWTYKPDTIANVYASFTLKITEPGTYVMSGRNTNGVVRVCVDGVKAAVTLRDLTLKTPISGLAVFTLENGACVDLKLDGWNELVAEKNNAGITVPNGCELDIDDAGNGTGCLTAMCLSGNAAGIGAASSGDCGTIRIRGGRISVSSGTCGTGIGCGWGADPLNGMLEIYGGTLCATGSRWCYPIKAASCVFAGGNVVVSGESVVGTAVNADGTKVGSAEVTLLTTWPEGVKLAVSGLPGYGMDDIYAIDGKFGFWLPTGTYSFTVSATGLSGETLKEDYTVEIKAQDVGGESGGEDVEEPELKDIHVTEGTLFDCVEVTWEEVKGATSYRVYRSSVTTATKLPMTVRASNVTSPWKDRTAKAGTKYKYWIEAITDKGTFVLPPAVGWMEKLFEVDTADKMIGASGGGLEVRVDVNESCNLNATEDWIVLGRSFISAPTTVKMTVAENTTGTNRMAEMNISVSPFHESRTIRIYQSAAGKVLPSAAWAGRYPALVALYGDSPLALAEARSPGADGKGKFHSDGTPMMVWEDYVCGTDPTDPEDQFRVEISVENGLPKISWHPNLNTNGETRVYKVYGTEKLGCDIKWEYPTTSQHRYFKVSVDMP